MLEKICVLSGSQENDADTFWFTGFPINLAIPLELLNMKKAIVREEFLPLLLLFHFFDFSNSQGIAFSLTFGLTLARTSEWALEKLCTQRCMWRVDILERTQTHSWKCRARETCTWDKLTSFLLANANMLLSSWHLEN